MSRLSARAPRACRRRSRPWIGLVLVVTASLVGSGCGGSPRAGTTALGTPPTAIASEPARAPVGELKLLLGFDEAACRTREGGNGLQRLLRSDPGSGCLP